MGAMDTRTAEIKSKEDLRAFLSEDRALAVYFIGDLDDRYFRRCRWWGHRREDGSLDALALLYAHPVYPTLLTLGDAEGMARILEQQRQLWPARFHAHLLPTHTGLFGRHYRVSSKSDFVRMALDKAGASECDPSEEVVTLGVKDEASIAELLRHYPEAFFSSEDLKSGYYFGIYRGDALATMAGVHVVSPEYGVAALGNIVTRPSFRGERLATKCTAHLLHELFKAVDVVALLVKESNMPAIRVYERLGFRRHSKLVLGYCERSD